MYFVKGVDAGGWMNGSIKAWMAGWAALLALGTGMTGCSLEAPKAPSWDTTLNIGG